MLFSFTLHERYYTPMPVRYFFADHLAACWRESDCHGLHGECYVRLLTS